MNRLILVIFASMILITARPQTGSFTLTGDLSNLKAPIEWVYLTYTVNNQRITDSVLVRQDSYTFKGNIDEAVQAGLRIRYKADRVNNARIPFNSKRDFANLFLEPGNITVASIDSFSNISVSGSRADQAYRVLQAQARPYDLQLSDLYRQSAAARKNNDAETVHRLDIQIDSIDALANDVVYGNFVRKNPSSPLALYALKNWAGYEIDAAKVEPVFNTLPDAVKHSAAGRDMEEKLAKARKTAIGQQAIDFVQNDTLGKPLSLASFRGKYLLLDFWASWCGPCRAENPNLVSAYKKYQQKGFQVLSVSLDRPGAREKWLAAIHDDGLTWSHVSDLKWWDNAVARQYGIEAIPQNLLIDPNGKIIAKNLKGESLTAKLASIYIN